MECDNFGVKNECILCIFPLLAGILSGDKVRTRLPALPRQF